MLVQQKLQEPRQCSYVRYYHMGPSLHQLLPFTATAQYADAQTSSCVPCHARIGDCIAHNNAFLWF